MAVDSELEKEFAPLKIVYRHLTTIQENDAPSQEAYIALLLLPGQSCATELDREPYISRNKDQVVGLESRPHDFSAVRERDD